MVWIEWFIVVVFVVFLVSLGIVAGTAIRYAKKNSTLNRKSYVTARPSANTTGTRGHRTVSPSRLSVSTWSLRRQLGNPKLTGPVNGMKIPIDTHDNGPLSLIKLPERIAEIGIHTLEICHFHLPNLEKTYLAELRASLADADVELFSLTIDEGDITDSSNAERDIAWIGKWVDIAGELGAKSARVIGGKAVPSPETIAQSRDALAQLAKRADTAGVRLMSENWGEGSVFSTPENVNTILYQLDGEVGLCLDFGTWKGDTKYQDLAEIAPWAESCHAKAHFDAPLKIDEEDYVQCLDIVQGAGFSGPHTLVYDGPGKKEWESLNIQCEIVRPYLKK